MFEKEIKKNNKGLIISLTLMILLCFSVALSPLIYFVNTTSELSLKEKFNSLLIEKETTDSSKAEEDRNEIKTSGESWIAFFAFSVTLGGLILSAASVIVTYYFSREVLNVSVEATKVSKREEQERFLEKYRTSMRAFEDILKGLDYSSMLISMDYRYTENIGYVQEMRDKSFKLIADYFGFDADRYWKSTHAHFYMSHEEALRPIYLHSVEFLEKSDFNYKLEYYIKITEEIYDSAIQKKLVEIIDSNLNADRRLFGKLMIEMDSLRTELKDAHSRIHDLPLDKMLRIKNEYSNIISKKENGSLSETDEKVYEIFKFISLEMEFPSIEDLNSNHVLEIENAIIKHFQENFNNYFNIIHKFNSELLKYRKEVQEASIKIPNLI